MKKSDLEVIPNFYRGYIDLVEHEDLMDALRENVVATQYFINHFPPQNPIFATCLANGPLKKS
ncbi:MAG: hypothetical protein HC880_01020 [Bacteroidia bacterium]|nr:hypothetical protein [Bacteroidia bacterium]